MAPTRDWEGMIRTVVSHALMDLVDDLELGRLADARLADGREPMRVSLDAP